MFWDNYRSLCEKEKKSPNKVATELGIASGTVTGWKNGALPRKPVAEKIADYFGVTTGYLLGEKPDTPTPAPDDPLTAEVITLTEILSRTETGLERLQALAADMRRAVELERLTAELEAAKEKAKK